MVYYLFKWVSDCVIIDMDGYQGVCPMTDDIALSPPSRYSSPWLILFKQMLMHMFLFWLNIIDIYNDYLLLYQVELINLL